MKRETADVMHGTDDFPHLPAAPIVEAVIHWRARATKTWKPDELRKELSERMPDYPDCRPQRTVKLEAKLDPDGPRRRYTTIAGMGFA